MSHQTRTKAVALLAGQEEVPISVHKVAADMGVSVERVYLPMTQPGFAAKIRDRWFVFVNASHSPCRRRGMYVCGKTREFREGRLTTIEDHLAHEWVLEAFFRMVDVERLKATKERVRKRAPKKKSKIEILRRQAEKVERSTLLS